MQRVVAIPKPLAFVLPPLLTSALLGLSWVPRVQAHPVLVATFQGTVVWLALWQLALAIWGARGGRVPRLVFIPIRAHWVQGSLQLFLYAYWGWAWRPVYDHVPLLAAQIVLAYVLDLLVTWSRRDSWALTFGPLPIILSTNLFIWFKDDWFYLQFLLVAVGVLGKHFLVWTREGRRTHIFNPSALSLFLFSVVLLATGSTQLTWGNEIATTQGVPEHIFLEIFGIGLVVQYLFSVTLVTLCAALALCALNLLYTAATGVYFFHDIGIPAGVFLGLHFLITDPSTSPRNDRGRALFGLFYGVGVFVAYGALGAAGLPRFYDKLLCVPILNLCVPLLDRLDRGREAERAMGEDPETPMRRNLVFMGAWSLLFAWMMTSDFLGPDHPGMSPDFWRGACERELPGGCKGWAIKRDDLCDQGMAQECRELGAMLAEGRGLKPDPARAAKSFGRGCDLGLEAACHDLTLWVERGGDAALRESCQHLDGFSCFMLGSLSFMGERVPQDLALAARYFRQSCRLGVAEGCDWAERSTAP